MKKRFIVGLALLMVMVVSSSVFASVSIGVKGWSNSWERTDTMTSTVNGVSTDTEDKVKSEAPILMVGPSLNIRSGSLFLGASYLQSNGDYVFSESGSDPLYGNWKVQTNYKRKDIDAMIGLMLSSHVGVYVGFKSLAGDITGTYTQNGAIISKMTGTFEITGPGVGIVGNIPLGDTLVLYGNLSVMQLTDKDTTNKDKIAAAAAELGLAFAIGESLSANVGFKSQTLASQHTEKNAFTSGTDTTKHVDKFSGVTAGLNFTF